MILFELKQQRQSTKPKIEFDHVEFHLGEEHDKLIDSVKVWILNKYPNESIEFEKCPSFMTGISQQLIYRIYVGTNENCKLFHLLDCKYVLHK